MPQTLLHAEVLLKLHKTGCETRNRTSYPQDMNLVGYQHPLLADWYETERGPDANPAFRFWAARCYFRTEKVLRPLTATAGQFALPGHSALSCTSPVHSPPVSALALRLAATSHAMRARLLRAATRAKSSKTLWTGLVAGAPQPCRNAFGCTGLRLQPDVSRLSGGLSSGLRPPFPSCPLPQREYRDMAAVFGFPQGRLSPCRNALFDSHPTADPAGPFEVAAPTCGFQSTPSTLRVSDACLRFYPGRFKPLSCITGHGFAFVDNEELNLTVGLEGRCSAN